MPILKKKSVCLQMQRKLKDDCIIKMEAQILGSLAIHPNRNDGGEGYNVTAIGTGYRLLTMPTEQEALKCAEVLYNACKTWELDDVEEVRESTPDWIKEWVKACQKELKCLPTKPFRK